MSKTIEQQIEKSRGLVGGLRKHVAEKGEAQISVQQIAEMEQSLEQLQKASDEVERLREELAPKVKHMNELLAAVKVAYNDRKMMIKNLYPLGGWTAYGVPDKR
ncbi:MAG: hypothetical protein K6A32_04055 [Bacteroidales bacterium]|nr:hypothetical protein [Bacteroidales bacterium]